MSMLQIQKHNRSLYKYVGWPISRLCLTFLILHVLSSFINYIESHVLFPYAFSLYSGIVNSFIIAWVVSFSTMWFENYVPAQAKNLALLGRIGFLIAATAIVAIVVIISENYLAWNSQFDRLAILAGILTPIGVFGFMWTADHGEQLLLSKDSEKLLH